MTILQAECPAVEGPLAIAHVPDIRAFTILETAKMLGVSKHYVYARVEAGELRTVDLGEGRHKYRVTAAELRRFLDARTGAAA